VRRDAKKCVDVGGRSVQKLCSGRVINASVLSCEA